MGGASGGGSGVDAGPDAAPAVRFSQVRDVITNCVFCHPGEVDVIVNSDFADGDGLYDLLVKEEPTPYVPQACAFKRLVVPGKPEESLLYLKLQTPPPPNCGERMPRPAEGMMAMPAAPSDIQIVHDWIAAGAPSN